jgi:hypothetical protein
MCWQNRSETSLSNVRHSTEVSMKRAALLIAIASLLGGCASYANNGNAGLNATSNPGALVTPNGVPIDPTYPGPGAYGGLGFGSWGGVRGGGVGFGMGF